MITRQQIHNHVIHGPAKEVVEAVKAVLPQREKFSTHLTAFVDHGKVTRSEAYIANELNALLNSVQGSGSAGTQMIKSVVSSDAAYRSSKSQSALESEYLARRSGWLPSDQVPNNYGETVKRLESWRIALEKESGMALTLVHSLRGSANRTNPRSNHRPENGGTAADFQPIGVKWSDASGLILLKAAQAVKQPVNQVLIEPSDKGGIIVHIDVKVPGKSDKRIATKGGKTINLPTAKTPTASPRTSANLDVAVFIDLVMTQCFKYEALDGLSRRCVVNTLRMESRNVVGERLRLNVVNQLGYCGPFQFGLQTWNGVATKAGISKFTTKSDFIAACRNESAGGPGDPIANAKALAAFWNDNVLHLRKALGPELTRRIVTDDVALYIAHQQGAGGAVRFFKTGKLLFPNQSTESLKNMREARLRVLGGT